MQPLVEMYSADSITCGQLHYETFRRRAEMGGIHPSKHETLT